MHRILFILATALIFINLSPSSSLAHGLSSLPSGFNYKRWQIKLNKKKSRCMHRKSASGDTYSLELRNCVNSRDQLWFMTTRGELRSVKKPNHCVTRVNGDQAKLKRCKLSLGVETKVPANQYWDTKRKRIRQGDFCLTSNSTSNNTTIKIKRCSDLKRSKKKWVTKHLNNRLRAKHLASFGVHDFTMCKSIAEVGSRLHEDHTNNDKDHVSSDKDNCIINAARFNPDWGYRYGTGQPEVIQNAGKLDFGERYSVERCSHAHDSHWVKTSHENFKTAARYLSIDDKKSYREQLDWVHFIHCLKRVKPSNEDEELAQDHGITGVKFFKSGFKGPTSGNAKSNWGELRTEGSGKLQKNATKTKIPQVLSFKDMKNARFWADLF